MVDATRRAVSPRILAELSGEIVHLVYESLLCASIFLSHYQRAEIDNLRWQLGVVHRPDRARAEVSTIDLIGGPEPSDLFSWFS